MKSKGQVSKLIDFIKDINECAMNMSKCDENANCSNNDGSYNCTCNPGYEGNGFNCTGNNISTSLLCTVSESFSECSWKKHETSPSISNGFPTVSIRAFKA